MAKYKRIVSIGAHPLDAEIIGGPMIIKYASKGSQCTCIHLTKGRLTDKNATDNDKKEYDERLHKEIKEAAETLGAGVLELDYISSELPSEEDFILKLMEYLKREKVDCVITHARGTLHPRHYYAYSTVTEAVRRLRSENYNISLFYGENCEDLAGFTPTSYLMMDSKMQDTWFSALKKYSIFNGAVNDMPYYEYYHAIGIIRAVEAGTHGFAKAYMHAALIDNE